MKAWTHWLSVIRPVVHVPTIGSLVPTALAACPEQPVGMVRAGPAGVDRHCEQLFLSAGARERDTNLLFVRDRLLRSEADLAGLLDLYGRVRTGKRVGPDDTNPLLELLRLSGVVRLLGDRLNNIYQDLLQIWDQEHPEAGAHAVGDE